MKGACDSEEYRVCKCGSRALAGENDEKDGSGCDCAGVAVCFGSWEIK